MLSKKQIIQTLKSESMPSLVVNELNIELQNKLKKMYPHKKDKIEILTYESNDKHSAFISNEFSSKLKFKLKDYKDEEEFMFYLKNSQKAVEIHNYEMKHMFEGIPLEDEDIYKSISNDNGKKDTLLIMKAPPFTENDSLNIKIKIEEKYKELKFCRVPYDSKKEMKYLYQNQFIKITMLIDRGLKYISWNFHHLFNSTNGYVKVEDIIVTYKILISLASSEIYTTNMTKFNNGLENQNKEILESLKKDLKLFEIINDFQKELDQTFEISTPFNNKEILEGVKVYLQLYGQRLLLEETHLHSLVIQSNSFNLDDIGGKKFTFIQEEKVTKDIFNKEITYIQYECYYQVKSTNYKKLKDNKFKLNFNPEDSVTIIFKATFDALEKIKLEEMTFEKAETIDTLINNYTHN